MRYFYAAVMARQYGYEAVFGYGLRALYRGRIALTTGNDDGYEVRPRQDTGDQRQAVGDAASARNLTGGENGASRAMERILIKDEACNPSGSFKDRRASVSLYHAENGLPEHLLLPAATTGRRCLAGGYETSAASSCKGIRFEARGQPGSSRRPGSAKLRR